MIIFDAHLDLAWNAIDWNRDLLKPVAEIRQAELAAEKIDFLARGVNTVSFPELRRGKVGIFIATLLARLFRSNSLPPLSRYSSMQAAYASAHGQMAYYKALVAEGVLVWITDAAALKKHVQNWLEFDAGKTQKEPPLGFILSMEGADPILHPYQVEEWYGTGLRIVGPAHYGVSPYAHGTSTIGGLFDWGKPLLQEMDRLGMILDVTHLSDQCFAEALEIYKGPVLASHHNCRALVDDQRQLSDEQINRLIERGAVIGAAFDAWMLSPKWVRGKNTPQERNVTIATVVDHIDHVCQLAGNVNHSALGTDLDGGFGKEQSPHDLDTIVDLQRIPDLLKSRGYSPLDIEKIMWRNWFDFFVKNLK
ncbi:membrane dipeptidase [Telmatocola sphagniphila]|uniref:Membrane dipeptidase n=1 Tax=Telmatocola sphagniphila TaxID=1123043 RepID=A0A8E6B613_9BACT|nr:membrane dipeptidase [Telmatocola sphagniphila]QVL32129.1 membrane dipeptidase [Telmatocola sphagniphila]